MAEEAKITTAICAARRLARVVSHISGGNGEGRLRAPCGGEFGGGRKQRTFLAPAPRIDPRRPKRDVKDEYGDMKDDGETWVAPSLVLESGQIMQRVPVRYNVYGKLNARRDNVIFVCHALTGNSALHTWWGGLLGSGKPFDTDRFCVVCANMLGSCYGTCGPTSVNPATGRPYGKDFPAVTLRDTVALHIKLLRDGLKVSSVRSVVGGSNGGCQALEWGALGKGFVQSVVAIACGARQNAWQIALNELQRQAIFTDPNYNMGAYDPKRPPARGLALAREIAMVSYRSYASLQRKFARRQQPQRWKDAGPEPERIFAMESYLRHQGRKFYKRFDANSYLTLMDTTDSHDMARGRGTLAKALGSMTLPVLVIGVDSDLLYPYNEQVELVQYLPNARLVKVKSLEGHDGFLLEQDQVGAAIKQFLRAQNF